MAVPTSSSAHGPAPGPISGMVRFCLENKLVVLLLFFGLCAGGFYVMPFDIDDRGMPRDPIPVDAFPDIGENQQIVFTEWPGRSPQDVEDQLTYPLVIQLQGVPGVTSIRAQSMFGFSMIFVIFEEDVDFYWARSRILERLSVAAQDLPEGVVPALGPDATALGQIFWYTLEARDREGNPVGDAFSLEELRSIQDWDIRYALQAAGGVSEVASVGGYVRQYQIDVDPDAMRAHGVSLREVFMAARRGNIDVGAGSISWSGVEYVIRGLGFIESVEDIEQIVIEEEEGTPIRIRHVARVVEGPAPRRGALDDAGAEAVGGVVVARYGENPLEVLENVKGMIAQIEDGLPRKTMPDGREVQVEIVPFYDRTELIHETLGTLENALTEEILITIFVVLMFVFHFRSSLLISVNLPLAVLLAFILMWGVGVDSNLMSLGGIAIAIGTMVDMGIILAENILRHVQEAEPDEPVIDVVHRASAEVGGAVVTAIATTVISFLPVFALTGAEGKMFKPLAYTKTFALIASVVVALILLPPLAHVLFARWRNRGSLKRWLGAGLAGVGLLLPFWASWAWILLSVYGLYVALEPRIPEKVREWVPKVGVACAIGAVLWVLTNHWMPLGIRQGLPYNLVFVLGITLTWTLANLAFIRIYPRTLLLLLRHKLAFMVAPLLLVLLGLTIWLGFGTVFGWVPDAAEKVGIEGETVRSTTFWVDATHEFPGLGREFMPPLDEGSYLWMPTTMPHASFGEALDIMQRQDMAIEEIPEVDRVVGKLGRVDSPLDPAPVSMVETIITYLPEWGVNEEGERVRQWRDHIETPSDIWDEIVRAAQITGSTSAPRLQPIAARLVMLQTGMRAPMGIKVFGSDLETVEDAGFRIAELIQEVPSVNDDAVIPDQVIGKPYLEIDIDRERIARYGVNIRDVQDVIEVAMGGVHATMTVEGRERYAVRVRYLRELRDAPDDLGEILVPAAGGVQVPLAQLADIEFVRGPQAVKSEDTFKVSYVLFDRKPGHSEVDVVESVRDHLSRAIDEGRLELPRGVHYEFSGSYEGQVRFQRRLKIVLPLALFLIFLVLYFQFRKTWTTFIIFSAIAVAWSGGFLGLYLTGQEWFLDVELLGRNLREVFNMTTYNLSVAVWVGFLALFGIATDDGVIITTYLDQVFDRARVGSRADIRKAVAIAGMRRIRPCLMTVSTTILALLPVLTSQGRGADVMIPMALPSVWGMAIVLITLFTVPVLYCWVKELQWRLGRTEGNFRIDEEAPPVGEMFAEARESVMAGFAGGTEGDAPEAPVDSTAETDQLEEEE